MTQMTIEPTPHWFRAEQPVMLQMWTGQNSAGLPVVAFMSAVVVGTGEAGETATAMGLVEIPRPSPEDAERSAKNILSSPNFMGRWEDG